MACFSATFSCYNETLINSNGSSSPSVISQDFFGKKSQNFLNHKGLSSWNAKAAPVHAQASYCVSRSMRWWEKTIIPNMIEVNSAQELVDTLSNSGDRLVILDFYSPGCGGCKSLHPKLCQLAESNPNAIFLKVNYEELKPMCSSLHIHVLPFFRFYRGAEGRLCSFSCTNATIKKFKDALAKYGTDGCSLGPSKGLDESELLALVSIGQLSKKSTQENILKDFTFEGIYPSITNMGLQEESNKLLVA